MTRPLEKNIHSFVVKLWLEEETTEQGVPLWRGQITHVPSGDRSFFQNLGEIMHFITQYLVPK